jgi:hypothetical protein
VTHVRHALQHAVVVGAFSPYGAAVWASRPEAIIFMPGLSAALARIRGPAPEMTVQPTFVSAHVGRRAADASSNEYAATSPVDAAGAAGAGTRIVAMPQRNVRRHEAIDLRPLLWFCRRCVWPEP